MIARPHDRPKGCGIRGSSLALSVCLAFSLAAFGCERSAATAAGQPVEPKGEEASAATSIPKRREIRATGTVQAVRYLVIQTPRIRGRGGRMTLVSLVPNGAIVEKGDLLAEFDPTVQLEARRKAEAQFEDLGHQSEQKLAENEAEAAKRRLQLREAETELAEAEIELRKGPLLSEIDRLKNETKATAAKAKVESLQVSSRHREDAGAAALRVLQLQRDRQRVALERAENNLSKLELRSPLSGMAALEAIWRNGSMGHAQEGDQLSSGRALLRIFDSSEMEVSAYVAETDRAVLEPGRRAVVELDAYPGLRFTAQLESASPVAASAIGSPIKTFLANFRLEETDPRLLPDLSAVVIIPVEVPLTESADSDE